MSRKTVIMKRKGAQIRRKGGNNVEALFPTGVARSTGRKTMMKRDLSEDGVPTTPKRVPGVASGAICTEPMNYSKHARLRNII